MLLSFRESDALLRLLLRLRFTRGAAGPRSRVLLGSLKFLTYKVVRIKECNRHGRTHSVDHQDPRRPPGEGAYSWWHSLAGDEHYQKKNEVEDKRVVGVFSPTLSASESGVDLESEDM